MKIFTVIILLFIASFSYAQPTNVVSIEKVENFPGDCKGGHSTGIGSEYEYNSYDVRYVTLSFEKLDNDIGKFNVICTDIYGQRHFDWINFGKKLVLFIDNSRYKDFLDRGFENMGPDGNPYVCNIMFGIYENKGYYWAELNHIIQIGGKTY